MDVLSIIDPTSAWSVHFMYSGPMRRLLIKTLLKNSVFMEMLLIIIFKWIYDPFIPEVQDGHFTVLLKRNIEFTKFVSSLNMAINIIQHKSSSCLFPIVLREICMMKFENVIDISLALIYGLKDIEHKKKVICPRHFIKFLGNKISQLIRTESHFFMIFEEMLYSVQKNHELYLDLLLGLLNEGCINPTAIPKIQCSYASDTGKIKYGKVKSIQFKEVKQSSELFFEAQERHFKLVISFIRSDSINIKILLEMIESCLHLVRLCENVFYFQDDRLELFNSVTFLYESIIQKNFGSDIMKDLDSYNLYRTLTHLICCFMSETLIVHQLSDVDITIIGSVMLEVIHTPKIGWHNSFIRLPLFILSTLPCFVQSLSRSLSCLKNELSDLWNLTENNNRDGHTVDEKMKVVLSIVLTIGHSLEGVKSIFSIEADDGSSSTIADWKFFIPTDINELVCYAIHNNDHFESDMLELALFSLQIFVGEMDSSLYLQSRLNYQECLMSIQSENVYKEKGVVIIDEFAILRQEIIEMSFGKQMLKDRQLYIDYLVTDNLQPPKTWPRVNDELHVFLIESEECIHDSNWIKYIRKLFRKNGCRYVKSDILLLLLDEMRKAQLITIDNSSELFISKADAEKIELCAEEKLGIHQTIRFGLENNVLVDSEHNYEKLSSILKQLHVLEDLTNQNFTGFDWFVATVYLIGNEKFDQTMQCLSLLSNTPFASFMWYHGKRRNNTLIPKFWHIVEYLVALELPTIHNAFQVAGVCTWKICEKWAKECFWRVIDWTQICQWLIFGAIFPVDYIIYYFLSIFKDYEETILKLVEENKIWKLLTVPEKTYNIHDYFTYMDTLHKRHQNMIHSILMGKNY